MKKYIKPEMEMVQAEVENMICESDLTSIPQGTPQNNVTTDAPAREVEDAINDLW